MITLLVIILILSLRMRDAPITPLVELIDIIMLTHRFLEKVSQSYALTSEQEKVFLLRFAENKTNKEISQKIHCSEAAVTQRLKGVYQKFNADLDSKIAHGGRGQRKGPALRNFLLKLSRKSPQPEVAASPLAHSISSNQVVLETGLPKLAQRMRAWFISLGYTFESPEYLKQISSEENQIKLEHSDFERLTDKSYFEWLINVPERRGYSRILVRGYDTEISLSELNALEQDQQRFERIDEIWLLTIDQVSQAARKKAEKETKKIFCYTFDELIDENADFSEYFTWLDQTIEEKQINEIYVNLACTKDELDPDTQKPIGQSYYGKEEGWIDNYVDRWLEAQNTKQLSILGEFGTGKTSFIYHYAYILSKRYRHTKDKGIKRPPIPLVVPLRDYHKAVTIQSLFSEFIFRTHNIPLPSYATFEELMRMGRILLLFDGFDEMADRVNEQKMINNFWELAKVVNKGAKAILTCRTEHFPKAQERQLLNAELLASTANIVGIPPQFEVLTLKLFDHPQILEALSKQKIVALRKKAELKYIANKLQNRGLTRQNLNLEELYKEEKKKNKEILSAQKLEELNQIAKDEAKRIFTQIEKDEKLLDLAVRPVMIDFILDSSDEILSGKPVDLSRIYFFAMRKKMERDIDTTRTFTSMADKLYFLCELAWQMLFTNEMSINYKNFSEEIKKLFNPVIKKYKEDLDHWHYDMASQTVLTREQEGNYKFGHLSLRDFFVAYKLAAELGALGPDFIQLSLKNSKDENSQQLKQNVEFKNYTWSALLNELSERRYHISVLPDFIYEPLERLKTTLGWRPLHLMSEIMIDLLLPILNPNKTTEEQLLKIIQETKGKTSEEVGYVNGNIMTLLVKKNSAVLEGRDLSNTIIKGGYLEKATLCNASLAHADLSESTFINQVFGSIFRVAFSPDGKLLATGDANGKVNLWLMAEEKFLQPLEGHTSWVWALAFSRDGRKLVSGDTDGYIWLWDVGTGHGLGEPWRGHTCRVWSLSFSLDDREIISCSDQGEVKIWSLDGQEQEGKGFSESKERKNPPAFSSNSQMIAAGSWDNTIKIWDLNTKECLHTLEGHTGSVKAVAFSPDGTKLVSGSEDLTVRVWNLNEKDKEKQCLQTWKEHTKSIRSVAWSRDGQVIAYGSDAGVVMEWEIEITEVKEREDRGEIQSKLVLTSNLLKSWNAHTNWIWSLAFSPNSQILATGSDDQSVRVWESNSGRCLNILQGYDNRVLAVAFSPDGQKIASGSEDTKIRLWDVHTGKFQILEGDINKGHTNRVRCLKFSHNGKILASGSDDKTIKIWDVETGECLKTLDETLDGHTNWLKSVAFSPNEPILVSSSDDESIKFWDIKDIKNAKCRRTFPLPEERKNLPKEEKHDGRVWSVAFSPNGQTLVSASEDKTIKIWDVRDLDLIKCLKTFEGHEHWVLSVKFSPDGKKLASCSADSSIKLWDVNTGKCLKTLAEHEGWVTSVAFSFDGKKLASCSADSSIKLWDVNTGKCLKTLAGHEKWIWSLDFSPDGEQITTGSEDWTVKVWNVEIETGECKATFQPPLPYENTDITGVTGLTDSQKKTFLALGAKECELN